LKSRDRAVVSVLRIDLAYSSETSTNHMAKTADYPVRRKTRLSITERSPQTEHITRRGTMKIMLRAAVAAIRFGTIGPANAGENEGEGTAAIRWFTEIPGAVAQAPV
jgi:hypothetical protein